jgi:diguanylate cyclase (GGDEF)-like protein/PAS domain S-box-containing protein
LARSLDALHTLLVLCIGDEVVWMNRAGAASMGFSSQSEAVGRSFFEMAHRDYADLSELGLEVLMEEAGPLSIKLVHTDGHDVDVNMWVSVVEEGMFLVECHDISEHLRAARLLRQREQRLEGIINTVADGIITVDERGLIQTFNPAAETIFGFNKAEVIGKTVRILIPDVLNADAREASDWIKRLAEAKNLIGKKKGGEEFPVELSVREMQQGESLSFTGIVRDVTAQRAEEQRIFYMAHHDALTGLPNRHLFDDRVEEAFKRCHRHNEKMSLLFVDLDKFKPINDTYGHAAGDVVLKELARRMGQTIRATDTVARVGGDEFMVLLEELETAEEATDVASKIEAAVLAPIFYEGHRLTVGASIGIGVYPDDAKDISELMDFADQAMYHSKHKRR